MTRENSLIMEVSNGPTGMHSHTKAANADKSTKSSSVCCSSVSGSEAIVVNLHQRCGHQKRSTCGIACSELTAQVKATLSDRFGGLSERRQD